MASPRPKSPRTPNRSEKEESFWDKIGTLGRKKRIKEGNSMVFGNRPRICVKDVSKILYFLRFFGVLGLAVSWWIKLKLKP